MINATLADTPRVAPFPRIRLRLLPATTEQLQLLDLETSYLHDELCYHHEASDIWVSLPDDIQQQIDRGDWHTEIARLQVAELVVVSIEGRS